MNGVSSQTVERRHFPDRRDVPTTFAYKGITRSFRASWGAIFAGIITAVSVQLLLGSLGLGIGAAAVDPIQESNPLAGVGVGAATWFIVSTILSLFAGGWVAGRLSDATTKGDGFLHGFLTWGLSTILVVYMLTSAVGALFAGGTNLLGRAMSGASQVSMPEGLRATVENELQQRGINVNQVQSGDPAATQEAVDETVQQGQAIANDPQVQQQTRNVADQAARGVSQAGLLSFFLLLIGAGVGGWGGSVGASRSVRLTRNEALQ